MVEFDKMRMGRRGRLAIPQCTRGPSYHVVTVRLAPGEAVEYFSRPQPPDLSHSSTARSALDYSAYVRTLLSVFVGLGLGQLVQGLHRLARFEGSVLWDWLPLGWAFFAFVMVVQTWWAYFDILQSSLWLNLFAFLIPMSVFVTLYLICASALPDLSKRVEADLLDLTSFHLTQRSYFFGLWALFLSLALIVSLLVRGFALLEDGFRVVGIGLAIGLATSSRRPVHVALTLPAFVAFAGYIVLFSLRIS